MNEIIKKDDSFNYSLISRTRMYFLIFLFSLILVSAFFIILPNSNSVENKTELSQMIWTGVCACSFLYILKNFKYLRFFFKIHGTAELIAVICGFLLIVITLFSNIIIFMISNEIDNSKQKNDISAYASIRKELEVAVNRAGTSYILPETFAEELFKYTIKPIASYYFTLPYIPEYEFTDAEIKKYNLKAYVHNPTVLSADYKIYSVLKYKRGCKKADINNFMKSDCVIEIDTDGFFSENSYKTDRLVYVIKNGKPVPARETVNLISGSKK